jgi:hypothetical protein
MSGPNPHPVGPPSPDDLRTLETNAAEAQAFAEGMSDDPAAPAGYLLTGFQITDMRRFVAMLGEARACEDERAETVARALIAGYITAAVRLHDERAAAVEADPLQ